MRFLTTAALTCLLPVLNAVELPPIQVERTIILQTGETLSGALNRAGVSMREAHEFIQPLRKKVNMARFMPGQKIDITYTESTPRTVGQIDSLAFHTTRDRTAKAVRTGDAVTAELKKRPLEQVKQVAVGRISGSLYASAKRAGLPASLVPGFANLFAYELDFTRDLKVGDTFKVVFEEVQDENGEFLRTGNILAAELTANNKTRSAFRYTNNGTVEYYDEKGRTKKKLLLRTPLEFTRISSHYNLKRMHPILKYTRAHRGTDFAAPTGTPIKASGSGVVDFVGWKGGYGKYVRIRHNGTYKTAYAHLHKYARGMKKGKRVKQGQIIAYVGSTGRSTGPHLHYEVIKNGVQVNPMSTKLPTANPLPKREQIKFRRMVAEYQGKWQNAIQLASAE